MTETKLCTGCGETKIIAESFATVLDKRDDKQRVRTQCRTCYAKQRKTRSNILRTRINFLPPAFKKCSGCDTEKPSSEFYKDPGADLGLSWLCKICDKAKQKTRVQQAKLDIKRYRLQTCLNHARQRTAEQFKKTGIVEPFDIDMNYLLEMFYERNICPKTQKPFNFYAEAGDPNSPSLDKIIPALGYVKGNMDWISYAANRKKSDSTPAERIIFNTNDIIHAIPYVMNDAESIARLLLLADHINHELSLASNTL